MFVKESEIERQRRIGELALSINRLSSRICSIAYDAKYRTAIEVDIEKLDDLHDRIDKEIQELRNELERMFKTID